MPKKIELNITNQKVYKNLLRKNAVLDYTNAVIKDLFDDCSGNVENRIDTLLSNLDDIDNADLGNPSDERPF